jgi:hypothetical protein
LLVANEHVAPGKEIEKLAIPKEVAPIISLGMTGFDDQLGGHVLVEELRG